MAYEVNIIIPTNYAKEVMYVINFLFDEVLGIGYRVEVRPDVKDYVICCGEKRLVVRNHFWCHYNEESLSYLREEALPRQVFYTSNPYLSEVNIPVIYGDDEFHVSEDELVCGVDIFASVFFMLSRWEEYVNPQKDMHGRFRGRDSIAFQNHFLHRPVVNEYAEFLWNMLKTCCSKLERRGRKYQLVLTHDVDKIFYRRTKYIALLGDVLKRRDWRRAMKRLSYLLWANPYDTFDFIMERSERLGIVSHFYFMASGRIKRVQDDSSYCHSRMFKRIINEIKERGHVIGFHPGYLTFRDKSCWAKEKLELEKATGSEVKEGRQHYLRLDIGTTFRYWEENGMLIDSTLGYADMEGFRCGTGDEFHVFDFLRRKTLTLKERPLIIMDSSVQGKIGCSLTEKQIIYKNYIDICRKYKTNLTLLFHNSSFDEIDWCGGQGVYDEILNNGGCFNNVR